MSGRIDVAAVRRDWPVARVAGATVKLRQVGGELQGCCPFHEDRSPSFSVYDGGRRWICFAGCGEGDVLDFVMMRYGVTFREAVEQLYGGNLPTVDAPIVRPKDSGRNLAYAQNVWSAATAISGTPAEAYLRRRGIAFPLPDTLRFSRIQPPKDSGVLQANGPNHLPALIALVQAADGGPTGVQRTYLTEDGCKASTPDRKVKFSLGNVSGGAVRLGPVLEHDLVVTEGIEDGLSLMQLGAPSAWASVGSAMLDHMVLPDQVRSVIVGGDADEAGRRAAAKASAAFDRAGRAVCVIYPAPGFKDFNAELTELEERAA